MVLDLLVDFATTVAAAQPFLLDQVVQLIKVKLLETLNLFISPLFFNTFTIILFRVNFLLNG